MKNIYGYDTNIYETSIGNLKNIDKENHSVIATKFYVMQQELDQCKNNWKELKKYIEENKIDISLKPYSKYAITIELILNKMKELEEGK